MIPSAFDRLYPAIGDASSLAKAYDKLLTDLFTNPLWESGPIELRRVLWSQARRARIEDGGVFNSRGLYVWGIEDRPLYLGITRGSFAKRFSRYIWHPRSQCNLAHTFEAALVSHGIGGFPTELTEWYKKGFGTSKARLRGAVRFAKEGINRIWFFLCPGGSPPEIEQLERAAVPVADAWNRERGLRPLLNVEFNPRGAHREA